MFQLIKRTSHSATYVDIDMVRNTAGYIVNGEAVIKRLDELEAHPDLDIDYQTSSEDDIRRHRDTYFLRNYFGHNVKNLKGQSVKVYRGVSRADAKLRAGDFVTPDRGYARGYVRGKYGVIISDTVPAHDLIVAKMDLQRPEFIYYPEGYVQPEDAANMTPSITLREFWMSHNRQD